MNDEDFLVEKVGATAEAMGHVMTPAGLALIVDDLAEYAEADIDQALQRLRREGGRMSVAAIIERLPNGWPGPEEAWSMFPKHEDDTAVVTDEALKAWSVAYPVWCDGDHVAARMAFRESYVKFVAEARETQPSPIWIPTVGHRLEGRAGPLISAVTAGKITEEQANRFLPGADDCGPIVGLLTGNVSHLPQSVTVQTRIAQLRDVIGKRKANDE